jgi:hypothetical protein
MPPETPEGTGPCHLAGYPGDELEVLIDVEDGEPRSFSRRGDQYVGD